MAVTQESDFETVGESDGDADVVAEISTLDDYRDDVGAQDMNVIGTGSHSHAIVD